jgi:hypothetical protein
MKLLAGIGLAALMVAGNASATTIAVLQSALYNQGQSPISGSFTFQSVNFGPLSTITGVTLIYETDYTSPQIEPLQVVSTFIPNGNGMAADSLTTNYISQTQEAYLDTAGLTFVTEPNGTVASNGVGIVSGFNDVVTAGLPQTGGIYGSFAVAYTSSITQGQAVGASAEVEVLYTYTTSSAGGTPEPVSMILFGSGLLAVSLVGRKKFFAGK